MAFIGGTSKQFVKVFSVKIVFSPIRESLYLESFPPYGIQWNPSIADIINWDQQFGLS